jgi:Raf kinase inhibitor-like YbhB/YbcL family protein
MWDIPPGTESIAVNDVPIGAIQGRNGSGDSKYTGPCPPPGTGAHRYVFDLYALDNSSNLSSGSTRDQLEAAMKNHLIQKVALTGIFAVED